MKAESAEMACAKTLGSSNLIGSYFERRKRHKNTEIAGLPTREAFCKRIKFALIQRVFARDIGNDVHVLYEVQGRGRVRPSLWDQVISGMNMDI